MSNRILNHVNVSDAPSLVSAPMHVLDDATRDEIARQAELAYAQGLAEGRRAALDEARAEATAVTDAVRRAAAALQQTVDSQHAALADALGRRVGDATRVVIGREPVDEGRVLVERLMAAVERTDEVVLNVRVAASREAVAAEALAGRPGVTIEVDDVLGPDDAVITGAFARLDLRTTALLAALDELLVDQEPLGPITADEADEQEARS